jgi:hypothetical protein
MARLPARAATLHCLRSQCGLHDSESDVCGASSAIQLRSSSAECGRRQGFPIPRTVVCLVDGGQVVQMFA